MTIPRDLDDGAVWLEVASAVDYLAGTHRPGFTVWDALDEALRWWTAELLDPRDGFPPRRALELPWHDPDPLRSTIEALLTVVPPADAPGANALGDVFIAALAAWLAVMADEFNDGHRFASPHPRLDEPV
jgi:hypothetical protein